ncbi:hypothetical protein EF912_25540, partial [Streptomyces sp. WAC07061]
MGRHSRKAPAPVRPQPEPEAPLPPYEPQGYAADPYGDGLYAPGPYEPAPARHPRPPQGGTRPSAEPTVVHEGYASPRGPRPVGHPEHR